MAKKTPCHAGNMGLIPGWGTKLPHTTENLSSCATTTEFCVLQSLQATIRESVYHSERSHVM